jgi:hypothetical protein
MGDLLGDIIGGAQKWAAGAQRSGQQVVNDWGSQAGRVMNDAGSQVGRVKDEWGSQAARISDQASRQVRQVDTDVFGGNVGRVTDTAYNVATAPVKVPAAVAIMGAGAVAAYIGGKVAKARAASPENDGGVTYSHIDEQSGQPMKTDKYAEQQNETEVSWVEPISTRPAFKKVADLGLDRKTMSLISEGYDPLQAVDMRMQEESNPRTLRELDWQRLQLAQNKIELSSEYHNWAKDTGKPQSINPFENEGDAMQALKMGSRQEGKIQLSKANPGMADIFSDLPDGMGFEDASWDAAKTGFTRKSPSFTKAINKALSTKGDPGIYGTLNRDRNYDDWNRARPQAPVKVISPMEIMTGTKQRRTIPAKQTTSKYYSSNKNNELAMLRETGIMGNTTRNTTKTKKSAKDEEYFYGI